MRFLVVGGGSMGKRRIRCLLANGVQPSEILLAEVREERRQESQARFDVQGVGGVEEGILWEPDAVITSLPGALNIRAALVAARAGRPFLFESPLAVGTDGVDELVSLVQEHGILAAPGSQLAFHPLYRRLKSWMEDPEFGRPLVLHQEQGAYVPHGHPYEDYRSYYISKEDMGGANLDMIAFEFTWHSWLLGDRVRQVYAQGDSLSSLEIQGSDTHQLVGRRSSGLAFSFLIEGFRHPAFRTCRVMSESGTLELNIDDGYVRRFLTSNGQWEGWTLPLAFDYEQTYIDETGQWIRCLRGEAEWHISLDAAINVARLLEAIRGSASTGRPVELGPDGGPVST